MACCESCAQKEVDLGQPTSCGCWGPTAAGEVDPLSGLDRETHEVLEAALGLEVQLRGQGAADAEARAIAQLGCSADQRAQCAAFFRFYRAARFRASLTVAALEAADLMGELAGAELAALGDLVQNEVELRQYAVLRLIVGQLLTVCPLGTTRRDCAALMGGMVEILRAVAVAVAEDAELAALVPLPIWFGPVPDADANESDIEIRPAPSNEREPEPEVEEPDQEPAPPRLRIDIARSVLGLVRRRASAAPSEPSPAPAPAPTPAPTPDHGESARNRLPAFYRGEGAMPSGSDGGGFLTIKRNTIALPVFDQKHEGKRLYVMFPSHSGARLTLRQWQALERAWQEWRRARVARARTPELLPPSDFEAVLADFKRYDRSGFKLKPETLAVYAQARGRWEHFIAALWPAYRANRAGAPTDEEKRLARGVAPTLHPEGGFVVLGAACDREFRERGWGRNQKMFPSGCRYPRSYEVTRYQRLKDHVWPRLPRGISSFEVFEAAVYRAMGDGGTFETEQDFEVIPPPPSSPSSVFGATAADLLGYEIPEDLLAVMQGQGLGAELRAGLARSGAWLDDAATRVGRFFGMGNEGNDEGDDDIIDAVFSVLERPNDDDDAILPLEPTEADFGDVALGWLIASTVLGVVLVAGASYALPQVAPHIGPALKPTMDMLGGVQRDAFRALEKLIPSVSMGGAA